MSLERMICDSCGAPLEVPESAKFVTCRHCQTHLRVRRDESVHYTERLEQIEETTRRISERLDEVSAFQEVEALDREWMIERESYKVSTKHGEKLPSQTESAIGGILAIVFGSIWTIAAGLAFPPFALFGLIVIGLGLFQAVSHFDKATRYREAEARYRQRRQELVRNEEENAYE